MDIGTASAGPGEKSYGRLHVTTTALGGFDVFIPVILVNGARQGPKLVVSGAVHGNEITGSIAIAKLAKELDPARLRGTLIGVPVTNISAFERLERGSLWDGQILNRVEPKKDGSVTERVWYAFRNEIVARGDYHIDMHAGSLAYVHYTAYRRPGPGDDPEPFKVMREMALAFGVDQVLCSIPASWGIPRPPPPGPRPKVIPRILVEIGGGNLFDSDRHVETCMRGVTNVMRYLGMLEGKIEPQAEVANIYDASHDVYSKHGGFFDRLVKHGDTVRRGQPVLKVLDPFTAEERETVYAPVDGVVVNTGTLFKAGDRASMVFGKLVETVNLKEHFE